MNSTQKGDNLEDAFYAYLLDEKSRGGLVYGLPPDNCKIYKKRSYLSKQRGAPVQFDVVIELYQPGRDAPFLYVIFECKNHARGVPETHVRDFSHKLREMFGHSAKGVMVVSSRLQSGAEAIARSESMGIVKFDDGGLEIVADRTGRSCLESGFVAAQIFADETRAKSLKFSACYDGHYFGTIDQLIKGIAPGLLPQIEQETFDPNPLVPYVSAEQIKKSAHEILALIGYHSGPVDLLKICSVLSIDLLFTKKIVHGKNGTVILGSANFDRRIIAINVHADSNRERFTIGHELGHFCLKHKQFLRYEAIIERDLLIDSVTDRSYNYERLEFQANAFSSELLLPDGIFRLATHFERETLGILDRGNGYIFVDNQQCNYEPYNDLLSALSAYFSVSKQAIEIKLKNLGLVTDQRENGDRSNPKSIGDFLTSLPF